MFARFFYLSVLYPLIFGLFTIDFAGAQSSGGMTSSASQLQIDEAQSRALLIHSEKGGSLSPQDTVMPCPEDGQTIIGARSAETTLDVPESLLDEESSSDPRATTVIVGSLYVLPCR